MRSALLLASLTALAGCAARGAPIPDGCYRSGTGEPLFKTVGGTGVFMVARGSPAFVARIESDKTVSITPHFYLHDSGGSNANPHWVAKLSEPRRAGSMQYRKPKGGFVLRVPIDSWGELDVASGKPC